MKYLGPFLVGSTITVGAFFIASVTLEPLDTAPQGAVAEANALMLSPAPLGEAPKPRLLGQAPSPTRTVMPVAPETTVVVPPMPDADPAAVEAAVVADAQATGPDVAVASMEPAAAEPLSAPPAADPIVPEAQADLIASQAQADLIASQAQADLIASEAPAGPAPLEPVEAAVAVEVAAVPLPKPAVRPVPAAEPPPAVDDRFAHVETLFDQASDPGLAALVHARASAEEGPSVTASLPAPASPPESSGDDPLAAVIDAAEAEPPARGPDPAVVQPDPVVEPDPLVIAEQVPPEPVVSPEPIVEPAQAAAPVPAPPPVPPEPVRRESLEVAEIPASAPPAASEAPPPVIEAATAPDPVPAPEVQAPSPAAVADAPTAPEPPPPPVEIAAAAPAPAPPEQSASPAATSEPRLPSADHLAAIATPPAGSLKPVPAAPRRSGTSSGALQLSGVVVLDAGGFRAVESSQGILVRIADVEPLPFNRMCRDEATRRTWPCGAHARAALSRHVAGRTLNCEERQVVRRGQVREIKADCSVDGEDLAGWLVAAGWADAPPGDTALLAAADEARRAGLGQFAASPAD